MTLLRERELEIQVRDFGGQRWDVTHSTFGATGNPAIEGTQAVNNAIDQAMQSDEAGIIYFPPGGIYTLDDVPIYPKLILEGGGPGSVLKQKGEQVIIGPLTATSGDLTHIVKTGAGWATDAYANLRVVIVSGTGVGQTTRISSNTATELTLLSFTTFNPSNVAPDSTSVFNITQGATHLLTVDSGSADVADNITALMFRDMTLRGTSDTDGFYEHHHLLNLNGVTDVLVDRMKFEAFRSDAVYCGSGNVGGQERHNKNIQISNSTFDGVNYGNRNPISVIDCDGFTGENLTFRRSGLLSYAPGMPGCVDFEPDHIWNIIRTVRLSNLTATDCPNASGVALLLKPNSTHTVPQTDFVIENLSADGCLRGFSFNGEAPVDGAGDPVLPGATETTPDYDVSFEGGSVKNCSTPFYINGAKSLTIQGMVFEDCDSAADLGYFAGVANYNVYIRKNKFRRCGLLSATAINVREFNGLWIEENDFEDNGLADVTALTCTGAGAYVSLATTLTNTLTLVGTGSFITQGVVVGSTIRVSAMGAGVDNVVAVVATVTATVITVTGTPWANIAADTNAVLKIAPGGRSLLFQSGAVIPNTGRRLYHNANTYSTPFGNASAASSKDTDYVLETTGGENRFNKYLDGFPNGVVPAFPATDAISPESVTLPSGGSLHGGNGSYPIIKGVSGVSGFELQTSAGVVLGYLVADSSGMIFLDKNADARFSITIAGVVVLGTLLLGAKTVTEGATDSGGAGYKLLRVSNT